MEHHLTKVEELDSLKSGDIIRRVSPAREQQGVFVKREADGALIVCDVIDLVECAFLAEAGVIRPGPEDEIFRLGHRFGEASNSEQARQVVRNWSLFREYPAIQKEIMTFVENTYTTNQIMELNKSGNLRALFVPIQQKFKIGKFTEKVDWDKIRDDRFKQALEAMGEGGHMTYVAFIPGEQNHKPLFYTIGTKPHQETIVALNREHFAFKPSHAGHIKLLSSVEGKKHFAVDAGSNFLGAGIHTSLPTAEMVTDALDELFPGHRFEAMAGRGAFGIQQSY
jgi:hypothetical protein